jgi:predicted peroxiredoxin
VIEASVTLSEAEATKIQRPPRATIEDGRIDEARSAGTRMNCCVSD